MKPIPDTSNFIFVHYNRNLPQITDRIENKTKQTSKKKCVFYIVYRWGRKK